MKTTMNFALDKEDDEIIQLFSKLGMAKNIAKTLVYISQVDECKSADVEQGADLRQPEVSIALQELRKRGWVHKRDLKNKGKGRPVHLYKISTDLSDIVNTFEQEKQQEINRIQQDFLNLKNIIINK